MALLCLLVFLAAACLFVNKKISVLRMTSVPHNLFMNLFSDIFWFIALEFSSFFIHSTVSLFSVPSLCHSYYRTYYCNNCIYSITKQLA